MVLIECGGVCQRLELPFIIKLLFELHNLLLTFRWFFFHNCTTLMHITDMLSVSLIHVLSLLFGSSKILDVQIKIGLLSTDLKNKDSFYVIVLIRYFLQDFQVKICL